MVCFEDLPVEIIREIFENLERSSLLSTAIVSSSLLYPSDEILYRKVKFKFSYAPPYPYTLLPRQRRFLRTVSTSERCARYVNLLVIQEINYEGEEGLVTFENLERAMKLMVNLKKLSLGGIAYIQHAQLETATFSLTHLSINPACPPGIPNPNEMLVPILKAHPELTYLSIRGAWSLTEDDIAAVEKKKSDLGAHSSAVLFPNLEYIDSVGQEVLQPLLVGRRVKHLIFSRKVEEAGQRLGSPLMLPSYRHLDTLVIFVHVQISPNTLPIAVARHLTSLTRLNIHVEPPGSRSAALNSSDPLIVSVSQIRTLESLTLSAIPRWCTLPSDEEGLAQFLYTNCVHLKEAFVQSHYLYDKSHSHYGVGGKLIGAVGRDVVNKEDYKPHMLFR